MKILLIIAGVLNLAFGAFHIAMFWGIAGAPDIPEPLRISAYTFNAMAVLTIAFLAFAFLARGKEVMTTGLGAATLVLGASIYLWRAARDFIWPSGHYQLAALCIAIGVIHLVLLFGVRRTAASLATDAHGPLRP